MNRSAVDKSEHVIAAQAILRTKYLIDRYPVMLVTGAGWHCVCTEFATANDCRHTRESQGRHAAQMLIAIHVRTTTVGRTRDVACFQSTRAT
jgi:hypothetical protein